MMTTNRGLPMPPSTIDSKSLGLLRSLATWFIDAKVKSQEDAPNILRCVDEDRFTKWKPFLEEMKLYKEGNGYALLRLMGTVNIEKEDGFDTLFFPFQEVEIAKQKIQFGDYVRFTETQLVTTNLDCLIVVVPALKVG